MSLFRLILRSLWHYRVTGLAVLFGLALATAVITGSLVVGDSVTGSIRDTALGRIGDVSFTITSERPFDEFKKPESVYRFLLQSELLEKTMMQLHGARLIFFSYYESYPYFVNAIQLRGSIQHAETNISIPNIALFGVTTDFWELFPTRIPAPLHLQQSWDSSLPLSDGRLDMIIYKANPSLKGRKVALNAALARDIGAKVGDYLLVTTGAATTAPSSSLYASRSRDAILATMRVQVGAILPDRSAGDFTLSPATTTPRNLFIDLNHLQDTTGFAHKANLVLVNTENPKDGLASDCGRKIDYSSTPAPIVSEMIMKLIWNILPDSIQYQPRPLMPFSTANMVDTLRSSTWYRDTGLRLENRKSNGYLALRSHGMVLTEAFVNAAITEATAQKAQAVPSSVYLAQTLHLPRTGKSTAYALLATIAPSAPFPVGAKPLAPDGIWLNRWTAQDLGATVGDTVNLAYLVPHPDGSYGTRTMPFTVAGIVEVTGAAADKKLMPPLPGVTDADSIDAWTPPFPVDLRRVTPRDDAYWDQYRTTPKAFISPDAARAMWRSADPRADWVTSVLLYPPKGIAFKDFKEAYLAALVKRISPEDIGLTILPVRQQALEAAKGTTDFGQLFLAMSFFLVLSAAGLAAMLMRLTVERRAAEAGMLAAVGFSAGTVRRVLWGEGIVLTLLGALLGVPLGTLYAQGILAALGGIWAGAVNGAALWLHVQPGTLTIGGVSGLVVGLLAMGWSTRALSRKSVLELLAGWQAAGVRVAPKARAVSLVLLFGFLALAALCFGLTLGGVWPAAGGFFGGGAALLGVALSAAHLDLLRQARRRITSPTLARLALRSAAANRGRSLLVIGLIAGTAFIIVAVAANARDASRSDVYQRDSGAGGFSLRAITAISLPVDISTPEGREFLGFAPEDEPAFANVKMYPLLLSPGEDISCLNLARMHQPRLVGVSDQFIARGGFGVQAKAGGNAWQQLSAPGSHIPLFGDADSVMWSLHSGLGKPYAVQGRSGYFAGLLPGSIFAGELLVSETRFRALYPGVAQPRYFLIETPPGREQAVAAALRRNLGDFGVEVRTTRELLSGYLSVQNTYLSTFLALGGLGLLLGTVGLVLVLLRNAFERRREFALLLATGFTSFQLMRLLLWENIGLLVVGLLIGTVSALVAVGPHLLSVEARVNWGALIAVLAGMVKVGLSTCTVAARFATRGRLLDGLREDS